MRQVIQAFSSCMHPVHLAKSANDVTNSIIPASVLVLVRDATRTCAHLGMNADERSIATHDKALRIKRGNFASMLLPRYS